MIGLVLVWYNRRQINYRTVIKAQKQSASVNKCDNARLYLSNLHKTHRSIVLKSNKYASIKSRRYEPIRTSGTNCVIITDPFC